MGEEFLRASPVLYVLFLYAAAHLIAGSLCHICAKHETASACFRAATAGGVLGMFILQYMGRL